MSDNVLKVTKIARKVLDATASSAGKKQDEIAKITQDVLKKGSKLEKTLSDSASAQGKAFVNMQKTNLADTIAADLNNQAKEQIITDALDTSRKVVKKSPLSKTAKETVLNDINGAIEQRHLSASLSSKSAQESANDIVNLHPIDLELKKEALMAKHGDKLEIAHQMQRQYNVYRKNTRAMMDALYEVGYRRFSEDGLITDAGAVKMPKRIAKPELLKDTSMDEYINNYMECARQRFTTKGFVALKTEVEKLDFPKGQESVKTRLLEEINAELEARVLTDNHAKIPYEEIQEVFGDEKLIEASQLENKLAKKKQELMEKFGDKLIKD